MFVHKINHRERLVVLQLVFALCLCLTVQFPSTSSFSIFDYRNHREPASLSRRSQNQGLENADYTRFKFGVNLARMFQDLVRKWFSTVVTINVNVMGEQTVHVPKPTMEIKPSMEPNRTSASASTSTSNTDGNEIEETVMRLQRLNDITEAPRRVPLIKRMLGMQSGNGPFSPSFYRPNDERRAFRPFSIFGR